ncbi:MAG: uroporphyrinogen decarboxylase family protein [Methanosarcinaceae archaeon]
MTTREKFKRVLHWQKTDRVPNMDFGYWTETLDVWHEQGLPKNIDNSVKAEKYFGLEGADRIPSLSVNIGMLPRFQHKVLEDKSDRQIIQDESGVTCEVFKWAGSIPRYIKFPIETRQDWEKFKSKRLNPEQALRVTGDLKQQVEDAHAEGMPIRLDGGSLYGWLRNWMGVENISIALMTEPDWVAEMMEHLTQLTLTLYDKLLPGLDIDCAWWWEDMCYNHGPLLSPQLFNKLMVPRYKRITNLFKHHGIDVNILDCDGNIHELVPGWLEAGINCMFPIEAAHTNVFQLREEFGEDVLLFGAVDKIILAQGPTAIDRHLEELGRLVERGGFIPCVDHRVPPDVSLENYRYYLEKKQDIL